MYLKPVSYTHLVFLSLRLVLLDSSLVRGSHKPVSYTHLRELLSDIVLLFGEKNGTSSREGLMSCSSAEKMSLIRRSGVV